MSREFGEYLSSCGYFHNKVESIKNDLVEHSRVDIHAELIPTLDILYKIAYAISSVEAGDSGQSRSVLVMMEEIPRMIESLKKVDSKLDVYRDVVKRAIEEEVGK